MFRNLKVLGRLHGTRLNMWVYFGAMDTAGYVRALELTGRLSGAAGNFLTTVRTPSFRRRRRRPQPRVGSTAIIGSGRSLSPSKG